VAYQNDPETHIVEVCLEHEEIPWHKARPVTESNPDSFMSNAITIKHTKRL
jgi:hypothetical protein